MDQQEFRIHVRQDIPNRPPVITSEPVVDASVAMLFEIVEVPVGAGPGFRDPGDFSGSGQLSLVTANPGDQTISLAARSWSWDVSRERVISAWASRRPS